MPKPLVHSQAVYSISPNGVLVMNENLKDFLRAWLDWSNALMEGVELDTPYEFRKEFGLCDNVGTYEAAHPGCNIRYELSALLDHCPFPFGAADYMMRYHTYSQHKCPLRRASVKKHLDAYEELLCKS
ncbi:hypothetical protein HOU66_gp03 [Pectobacterium phage Arno160]|uniref:Uncharacterized protein n=1 Tax=Pectobacterium phage Arno160 TaxID=2488835 RepID=A0A3G8F1U1_9CAUD|nr:hypothetical protein HOU66_gp03 [Pectobacterium phage Arno160]AZF88065.1 hypothetical protein Arno160_gp03 [Pectobacterium phage Arno160]